MSRPFPPAWYWFLAISIGVGGGVLLSVIAWFLAPSWGLGRDVEYVVLTLLGGESGILSISIGFVVADSCLFRSEQRRSTLDVQ